MLGFRQEVPGLAMQHCMVGAIYMDEAPAISFQMRRRPVLAGRR